MKSNYRRHKNKSTKSKIPWFVKKYSGLSKAEILRDEEFLSQSGKLYKLKSLRSDIMPEDRVSGFVKERLYDLVDKDKTSVYNHQNFLVERYIDTPYESIRRYKNIDCRPKQLKRKLVIKQAKKERKLIRLGAKLQYPPRARLGYIRRLRNRVAYAVSGDKTNFRKYYVRFRRGFTMLRKLVRFGRMCAFYKSKKLEFNRRFKKVIPRKAKKSIRRAHRKSKSIHKIYDFLFKKIKTPKSLKSKRVFFLIAYSMFREIKFFHSSWGKLERFLNITPYVRRKKRLKPFDKHYAKKYTYIQRQAFRFMYGGLTFDQVWDISRKLRKRRTSMTSERVFSTFECRLDILLHRLGFSKTMGHMKDLIKKYNVIVNGRITRQASYVIKPNDIFGFNTNHRRFFRKLFMVKLSRMRTNNVLLRYVPFIECNFVSMLFAYITHKFTEKYLRIPFGFKRSLLFGLGREKL